MNCVRYFLLTILFAFFQSGTAIGKNIDLSYRQKSLIEKCVNKIREKNTNGYFAQHELCEYEIAKAEKKYGMPRRLFMAIGSVESGHATKNMRENRPWPWTICANGKSYYCSTKNAAIATTKKLMARGIRNIDVGCMQVNLLHHSKAFKNLEEAFTPHNNVEYAAKFFTDLKSTYNSWTHAVGYYHSKSAKHYKPYCSKVYNAWSKAKKFRIKKPTPKIRLAASKIKSDISFLPPYYSMIDRATTKKLHELGRLSLKRKTPKFLTQ